MDINYGIERLESKLFYNEKRSAFLYKKLNIIYTLQKKYQVNSIESLLEIKENLKKKIGTWIDLDQDLKEIKRNEQEVHVRMLDLAEKLSRTRRKAILFLEKDIIKILSEIGMPFV